MAALGWGGTFESAAGRPVSVELRPSFGLELRQFFPQLAMADLGSVRQEAQHENLSLNQDESMLGPPLESSISILPATPQRLEESVEDRLEKYEKSLVTSLDVRPGDQMVARVSNASMLEVRQRVDAQFTAAPVEFPQPAMEKACRWTSILLLLAGNAPRTGLCQKGTWTILVSFLAFRVAMCVRMLFHQPASSFSFYICALAIFHGLAMLALLIHMHRNGLSSFIRDSVDVEAERMGFTPNFRRSGKSDRVVATMYVTAQSLYMVLQVKLNLTCGYGELTSRLCLECMGGFFTICLAFTLLHLNRFLASYIDSFAANSEQLADVNQAAHAWTRIMAFINTSSRMVGSAPWPTGVRIASACVELFFRVHWPAEAYLFMAAFSILETVPLLGQMLVDHEFCSPLVPWFLVALTNLVLTFYVWQSAASVTEKCRACYSLISHVMCADCIITLQEQQVLANHIRLSDGGIRVHGMKVDRGLLVKAMSMGVTCMVAFGAQLLALGADRKAALQNLLIESLVLNTTR